MEQQESWGFLGLDELFEVFGHCANVSRDQHAPGLGSDPKNFRIGRAIRDRTCSGTKIN